MSRKEIIKLVISVLIAALTSLGLRLNTIRDYIARMNFRLAIRFPKKLKFFGDPMVIIIITIILTVAALGLQSCNVTRTVTTQSQYYQKGDTSVVIQTKTVESYDGTRKY